MTPMPMEQETSKADLYLELQRESKSDVLERLLRKKESTIELVASSEEAITEQNYQQIIL